MTTSPITTPLTSLLGIDYPIVQAGMSWASSSAALPAAVAGAGGLGVLAAGPLRFDDFVREVEQLRVQCVGTFAVNLPLYRPGIEAMLDYLAEYPVPVIIASQGGPKNHLARFHAVGTRWLHVTSTVEHSVKAAGAGVDGIVVVGGEAGGHPPVDLVSTLVIVRAVRRALPDIPLIASGGLVDGAGLAAALSLGADGAQFGTRFLASTEASVAASYKNRVVAAAVSDTRTVGRDLGMIRMLANEFSKRMSELEHSGASEDQRRTQFQTSSLKNAALDGDVVNGKVEAGQSAGLIESVEAAADIVAAIVAGYRKVLAALPS